VEGTAVERIAALFEEVAETHHRVFRISDGADDDWASWYADWLLNLSELPQLVGRQPVRSELVYALVDLDRRYTTTAPSTPWPEFYAQDLVERFV
jgi:hypothetical protein